MRGRMAVVAIGVKQMTKGYVEAFKKYGATLYIPRSSVSAFGNDGCLVVSVWQDYLRRGEVKGTLEYRDILANWKGNTQGRAELKRHLSVVQASPRPIKLVIAHPATPADAAMVGKVADESRIKKTFSIREDLVGSLESFDGDRLRIVFRHLT